MNGGIMNNSEITLNKIFSFNEKDLPQRILSEIESNEKLSLLKESVSKEVKEIKWATTFNEIIKKIKDLLNISIPDIMVKAWNKYGFLQEYLDKEKYPSDETILVPLSEHTIKSEHHPFVEILINDKSIGKIEFNINIVLTIKGIILKIQNGKIKELITGSCEGKGNVKYENLIILERDIESISLPNSIDFGKGISITSKEAQGRLNSNSNC